MKNFNSDSKIKTTSHNHFHWVLFVVIFLGAVGIIYVAVEKFKAEEGANSVFFSSSKHSIRNWKVYRNEEYGFELSYPKNILISNGYISASEPENTLAMLNMYKIPHGSDRDGLIVVLDLTLSEALKNNPYINNQYGKVLSTEVLEFNNIDWTKITYEVNGIQSSHFLSEHEGHTIWLTGSAILDFNQILSNFNFISSTSTENSADKPLGTGDLAGPTGWKTYANTKFKYSIKYPENWNLDFQGEHPRVEPEKSRSFNLANFDLQLPIYNLRPGQVMIYGYTGDVNFDSDSPYFADSACNMNPPDPKYVKEITIDGVKAIRYDGPVYSWESPSPKNSIFVRFIKVNTCYSMELSPYTTDPKLLKVFNEILSTFKFTK